MQNPGQIITRTVGIPGTDFSLGFNPQTVIMSWWVISAIILLIFILTRPLKLLPGRRQVVMEALIAWFDGMAKEALGKDGRAFLPLILTLFLFVLISNWCSVVPGLTSPTRDLNTCLGLGLLVFFTSHIWSIRINGLRRYLARYFQPYWFMFPSNIFSEIGKLLSHSFRLFGNIFAGGIIIAVIPLILVQLFKTLGIPLGVLTMPVVKAFFGLFIGGIQAFVFSMLALTYIAVLKE
ncbi:MAG: F0F1 ATP synthase subunit A [Candidatus Omnitrophota bacterium]|nr:MAG: F0F1 ATP synthase subunit A [Candidatus Omnitrophota bacterium]